jgi:glutathionylspermidine synthase
VAVSVENQAALVHRVTLPGAASEVNFKAKGRNNQMVFEVIGIPEANRKARVRELFKLGFTWADLGDEPYWIDQLITLREDTFHELFEASQNLWHIFDKAARFVIGRRDLYALLSIPEVLWDALDWLAPNQRGQISRYARFDFCLAMDGSIKLLELNADTPTGYVEAYIATPWMCERYKVWTPNAQMADLVKESWAIEQPAYAACLAYGKHLEDTGTIEMLVRHSGLSIPCMDCLDLWVEEGILRDAQDRPVQSLFALYPKEWMAIDDGGEALAYAIEMGHVQLYNPIHAIILQSKGLQAVIWGLHELNASLFTQEEQKCIETYMLPTYNKAVFHGNYVSKSMFGREGGSVRMYDKQGELELADQVGLDTSQFFQNVYQKRVELPEIEFHQGLLRLVTGVFVINGAPCGLLGRAGGPITGNSSHFVAMGVK